MMNELDLLEIFYNEMKAQGVDRTNVYISLDENMMPVIQQLFDRNIQLEGVQKLADICIANEWLERTTADYESDGEGQYRSDTYRTYEKLIKTEGFFSSLIR